MAPRNVVGTWEVSEEHTLRPEATLKLETVCFSATSELHTNNAVGIDLKLQMFAPANDSDNETRNIISNLPDI